MRILATTTLAAAVATTSGCQISTGDPCHQALLAEYGCCPYHGSECNIPASVAASACQKAGSRHNPVSLAEESSQGDDGSEYRDSFDDGDDLGELEQGANLDTGGTSAGGDGSIGDANTEPE